MRPYPSSGRDKINFVVACLRSSQNAKLGIPRCSRAKTAKKCTKKSVMHVQSCLLIKPIVFF